MVVIDTSVAFKWTDENEQFRNIALKILQAHIQNKVKITVPQLFYYELANAWATKTKLTIPIIERNLERLKKAGLEIEPPNFESIAKAIKFSKKYQVSVYDASYAVLAQTKKCDLITADTKFVDQVNLPFVKSLDKYR